MEKLPYSKFFSPVWFEREKLEKPFNPEVYFKDEVFWEPRDPTKEYEKYFSRDFGGIHGMQDYSHGLVVVMDVEGNVREYVFAEERTKKEDRERMAHYCQCKRCRASWCDPTWLVLGTMVPFQGHCLKFEGFNIGINAIRTRNFMHKHGLL
jgi:hypothetical protein